jgi:hypothetical protein
VLIEIATSTDPAATIPSDNEEILVSAAKFAERYEGPIGPADATGWQPYRPRGIEMAYFVVRDADGC